MKPFNERTVPSGTQLFLCLGRDAGARPCATRRGRAAGRRVPSREDLGAHGGRSGRNVARRPLRPGGDLLLPQRRVARLCATWPAAGPRRELARPTNYSGVHGSRMRRVYPPDQPHLRPGTARPFWGYGYQVWILPGEQRIFVLRGAVAKRLSSIPASRLVMVHTCRPQCNLASRINREVIALWRGLVRELGTDQRSVTK